jgi:hypothetical protein
MCTFRGFVRTVIYLGSAGLFFAGIIQFPSRPSVTTMSGVPAEQTTQTIDAQYGEMIKNSDALKYLVSGIGGVLCNFLVHVMCRNRAVLPVRVQVAPTPRAPPVPPPAPPVPPAPPILKEVIVHDLHPPTWVEKAYINSKRPGTSYPDPIL